MVIRHAGLKEFHALAQQWQRAADRSETPQSLDDLRPPFLQSRGMMLSTLMDYARWMKQVAHWDGTYAGVSMATWTRLADAAETAVIAEANAIGTKRRL